MQERKKYFINTTTFNKCLQHSQFTKNNSKNLEVINRLMKFVKDFFFGNFDTRFFDDKTVW